MRIAVYFALITLLASGSARAQQASQPDGLACFENLAPPEYPNAALRAHVDGSVWTTIHVSPESVPDKIDTQVVSAWSEGSKLLTAPVEKAIRAAKVKPACAGKTVSVVFRYQLYGEPTAHPKVTTRTEPPNLIWIESQPANVPESASNAPARH